MVPIEDLIGSVGDDTLITDSALNTARDIVNITPPEKLSFFIIEADLLRIKEREMIFILENLI